MFEQHPLIPLVFIVCAMMLILKQCLVKKRVLKIKLVCGFLLLLITVFTFFFYGEIKNHENWLTISNWGLLAVDVLACALMFTTVDFSISSQRFQAELTKSLDESKLYVLLDKKDRVKEISSCFIKDLGINETEAYGLNFVDLLAKKYDILSFNGNEATNDMVKLYYKNYEKRVKQIENHKMELELFNNDNAEEIAIYFNESPIISNDKYKGRIIIGEKKSEDDLMGIEKDLSDANNELNAMRSRFTTLIDKTTDGIFFNYITKGSIWVNDVIVKRLSLNGNSIKTSEFLSMIAPEDLAMYQERMKDVKDSYQVSYRFSNGSSYIYVTETGKKITAGKSVELCGIMTIMDNYRFAKTETVMDSYPSEPELLARIKSLEEEDKIFEIAYIRMSSIPEVNDTCSRAIGTNMMAKYTAFVKQSFVTGNQMFRVSGLDFVAIITDYRKMDVLKNNLINNDSLTHLKAEYGNQVVDCDVFIGVAKSDDHPSHKNTLANAKEAIRFCSNPNYTSNFCFYKDIRR